MHLNTARSAYGATTMLAELHTAEQLLVTTARFWTAPYQDPDNHHPDWRGGFVATDLDPCGVLAFDQLFSMIAASARRSLDIRHPCRIYLGQDEGHLLHLVGLLQRGNYSEASIILSDWLLPSAVRLALPPAHRFALALADRRLLIPLRSADVTNAACINAVHHANPGMTLIH